MNKIYSTLLLAVAGVSLFTGCIEEVVPQDSRPSQEQVSQAPGAFDNLVSNLTSNLSGKRNYSPSRFTVWDFGYTSLFLTRDVEGQDIIPAGQNSYSTWYDQVQYMGSNYALCQMPWTYYYGWINDCNKVIMSGGSAGYKEPDPTKKVGVGTAYAMRAMFYLDLARMYAAKPYSVDHKALTTVRADEMRSIDEALHSERMTWEEAFEFILKDLDAAEKYLTGYHRPDKYVPDLSVVYGLKARTYLEKQDWANAEKYAKLAQKGYTPMTKEQFLSHDNGFNKPNDAWMFATQFLPTDPNILTNDGDDSWGSIMIPENGFGCGYATNYGGVMVIDKHLYSTIPQTDFRRMCWVDFSIADKKPEQIYEDLKPYTSLENGPQRIYQSAVVAAGNRLGGYSMKFRNAAGKADVKYAAWCVSVPLMRVEEMMLIEAEAAGMQNLERGKQLLTAFAQTRDSAYVYGTHNEAYFNKTTSEFQNEVWWQRRVELWGEGFATFDIKRLNKGIIRSYPGTNHLPNGQWNTQSLPNWMVWAITSPEASYNGGMTLNPEPVQPTENSVPYNW